MDRELEELVWRRAGGRCEYCQAGQELPIPFEIDHILAIKHGRRRWSRHFRWEGPVLVGRTPSGRATVAVLEINLDYRVAFRQRLIEEETFPPVHK
jgi:hypothetical protein